MCDCLSIITREAVSRGLDVPIRQREEGGGAELSYGRNGYLMPAGRGMPALRLTYCPFCGAEYPLSAHAAEAGQGGRR